MWRVLARILRIVANTIWIGGISFAPLALLLYPTISDLRNPFPELLSLLGALIFAAAGLYTILYYALFDELPPFMTE